MTTRRRLIFAGAIALTAFLVAGVPATTLNTVLAPAGVALSGTTGSLWSGQAGNIRAQGVSLGRLTWQINPVSLLLGRLSLDIDIDGAGGIAAGRVWVSLLGTIGIEGFRAAYPLATLRPLTGIRDVDGDLSLDIVAGEIADEWIQVLQGDIAVDSLSLAIGGGPPVGSYVVAFDVAEVPADGTFQGLISDSGGPLQASGTLTVTPPGSWRLSGLVKPRQSADRQLRDSLRLFGAPDGDGFHEVALDGSI